MKTILSMLFIVLFTMGSFANPNLRTATVESENSSVMLVEDDYRCYTAYKVTTTYTENGVTVSEVSYYFMEKICPWDVQQQ